MSGCLLLIRNELRLTDHPALHAAVAEFPWVLPVYLRTDADMGSWPLGSASKWWLHHSLSALAADLAGRGVPLVVRRGDLLAVTRQLAQETQAAAVYWSRRYEPAGIAADTQLKAELRKLGLHAESFAGNLLFEPWTIKTQQGGPYQVFTPFWKACRAAEQIATPLPAPQRIRGPEKQVDSLMIDDLDLLPTIPWAAEFPQWWRPGESGAELALRSFLTGGLSNYAEERNRPDHVGTSRLSPHLHFGELSPRQVWAGVKETIAEAPSTTAGPDVFLAEIGWREFAHHVLFHFPHTPQRPLRAAFEQFPWTSNPKQLRAWQRGQTGYPIVDAGMRELWNTGWMHNRVRMIVGSFLCKDLLISWTEGADWFWDTLVDADLASNTLGWQWISGCGADAAPYFRIFNPVSQGERFDPTGAYIRRWIPELSPLPTQYIHQPWAAPARVLKQAGIELGCTYPQPIVDHAAARLTALDALQSTRRNG